MDVNRWLTIFAAAGHFALAVVVAVRGARGERRAVTRPLLGLLLALCLVNVCHVAAGASVTSPWSWVESASASLVAPFVLHLVVAFVGRRRQFQAVLRTADAVFGALAAACVLPVVYRPAAWFASSPAWAGIVLGACLPAAVGVAVVFRAHLQGLGSVAERARARLFHAAVALGAVGSLGYFVARMGVAVTRPGTTGTLFSVALLVAVVLRVEYFERYAAYALAASVVALGFVPVLAYLAVYQYPAALLVIATTSISLVVYATLRGVLYSEAAERSRVEQLATLGRLSAQMAHDLRNPLAAIKGAAQYLQVELTQGRPLDAQRDFVTIIEDEAVRMERVIEKYRRLGRLEPVYAGADLAELVRQVVERQALGARPGVRVHLVPAEQALHAEVDWDLLAAAVENLVRNAMESLSEHGGMVTVRISQSRGPMGDFGVVLVQDDGCGMTAEVRERAFEDFFTTKVHGSGLGLAFVRRVIDAHHGRVEIESEAGHGTSVRCVIPMIRPSLPEIEAGTGSSRMR